MTRQNFHDRSQLKLKTKKVNDIFQKAISNRVINIKIKRQIIQCNNFAQIWLKSFNVCVPFISFSDASLLCCLTYPHPLSSAIVIYPLILLWVEKFTRTDPASAGHQGRTGQDLPNFIQFDKVQNRSNKENVFLKAL